MDVRNQVLAGTPYQIPTQSDNETATCTCQHNGRQILNEILPLDVDELFTICYTESKLYLDFQAHRKNSDIVNTPWSDDANVNGKTRVVSLTAYTNQSFLPKTSKVTEMQTLNNCSRAGVLYSIDGKTTMKGPPMADSFYIETHHCLKKISEKQSSISVFVQIKYRKTVFGLMKGMIEKMSIAGLEEFWKEFCEVIRAEYGEQPTKPIRKTQKQNSNLENSTQNESFVRDFNQEPQKLDETACTKTTVLILVAIFFLTVLNVYLYNKTLFLEESHQNHDILKLHFLKNGPGPSDEYLDSFHKQHSVQTIEKNKWYDSLKETIHSLKEAENILLALKQWTDVRIESKIELEGGQSDETNSGRPSQEL